MIFFNQALLMMELKELELPLANYWGMMVQSLNVFCCINFNETCLRQLYSRFIKPFLLYLFIFIKPLRNMLEEGYNSSLLAICLYITINVV